MLTTRERLRTVIVDDHDAIARLVADRIATLVRERQPAGKTLVLGLATGSTPIGVYRELVRLHQAGLSLANVVTFNLDEYWPMRPDDLQSYHRFMQEHLFAHVDIPPCAIHIPDGTVPRERVEQAARE